MAGKDIPLSAYICVHIHVIKHMTNRDPTACVKFYRLLSNLLHHGRVNDICDPVKIINVSSDNY